ncbi:MAG: 2-amino-4-hydroxy-6-hydroxymethyldihydropteridine diphosphokinase [Gemmatimonadota bacterium]|nr:2-amino-4-hydroxy-6-hydroxymethyldihydropteridine diphosphokinase [Gemmatimonadota bacterium]
MKRLLEDNIYISLGSNLGCLEENLRRAAQEVAALESTGITGRSHALLTEPVGLTAQPDFLNQVLRLKSSLGPRDLLVRLLGIEKAMGRVREVPRWGPRLIDLDLLFYGQTVMNTEDLVLPHPQVWRRRFFLEMIDRVDSIFLQRFEQNRA